MEYIFALTGDRKAAIYDEGNNIYCVFLNGGRHAQFAVIDKDYHSNLCTGRFRDDLYLAYLTVGNELVWRKAFQADRLILFSGVNDTWDICNLQILNIEETLFLFYHIKNPVSGFHELRYIVPDGERLSRVLVSEQENIEEYEIFKRDEMYYLRYKADKGSEVRTFAIETEKKGRLNIEEYVLCSLKTRNELEAHCKNSDEAYNRALEVMQKQYEKQLKEQIHEVEKRYRTQYEELADLTKQIQNEGKNWRELYYKSIKKRNPGAEG